MIEARECKLVKARKPRCTDCSGNLRSPTDSDRVTPPSYFLAALALAVMIWLAIVGSCLPEGYHCLYVSPCKNQIKIIKIKKERNSM
ncbi:hypothetical protein TWF217_002868 [Orbilia oligospora]|nr:hypothetical protein TWF751_005358 [Orbilia oligospora]KAF3150771.1 hypothetical protein TWF751_005358 [Orbilia oligospora]KAF3235778.1 hypothetical protein TWF217_002868 [Orbilia oligospora]KAF3258817.1 hypothetical protein TWF128_004607 [Orbilia oligospora]KAF3274493.1 hypothetical protein TWF132_003513 [Orbilia oligospora]